MDNLDKFSGISITLLIIIASTLIFHQISISDAADTLVQPMAMRPVDPQFEKKIQIASDLLNTENMEKADSLIQELIAQFPYEGKAQMMLGDLHMRRQEPIAAMIAYKEAVQLNPDFLDKKTPAFQGKKIKNTVKEARNAIETGLQHNPNDAALKEQRKTVYYMMRKIAGSCG